MAAAAAAAADGLEEQRSRAKRFSKDPALPMCVCVCVSQLFTLQKLNFTLSLSQHFQG